jgi:hypothetical protein
MDICFGPNFPHLKQTETKEIQMNTKTLAYSNTSIVKPESFTWITKAFNSFTAMFIRSDLEMAQAHYKLKRKHQAQDQTHRDIVRDMPIEQKLQLGCYHLMD